MIRNWKERTDRLRNVMEEAVASGEECGCQLVVYEDGERVVDLCAGFAAPDRRIPIRNDALFPIFSVGKGVMATAFHRLVEQGKINRTVAKEVFEVMFTEDMDPVSYVEEKGLSMVQDEGALRSTIEEIVKNNPQSVEDYKGGKKKALGFLVGQTMKAMKGKADPAMVNQILLEILG